jgi:hypothetical protein
VLCNLHLIDSAGQRRFVETLDDAYAFQLLLAFASKRLCIRSTPTEMQSISENDFECMAKTGVNTPETMFSTVPTSESDRTTENCPGARSERNATRFEACLLSMARVASPSQPSA